MACFLPFIDPVPVAANARSIVHKGDGQQHVAAAPDVCKTPSPAGPIPIPYVNVAASADLAGTKSVKIEGQPAGNADAKITTSTGDEPGSAGGIISSKIKGQCKWVTCSPNVKLEGKGAVRFLDVTLQNANRANTCSATAGRTIFTYGDDGEDACHLCGQDPESHEVPATEDVLALARQLHGRLTAAYNKSALKQLAKYQAELDALRARLPGLDACITTLDRRRIVGDRLRHSGFAGLVHAELRIEVNVLKSQRARIATEIQARAPRVEQLQRHVDQGRYIDVARQRRGYMIGVMICKCGQTFAAMSGETLAGFATVVEEFGWNLCGGANAVSWEEMASVHNRRGLVATHGPAIRERWQRLQARSTQPGCNPPGVCAAAKLLGRTRRPEAGATGSHHVPAALVEIWWAPPSVKKRQESVEVNLLEARYDQELANTLNNLHAMGLDFRWAQARRVTRRYGNEEIVPSCSTCQHLLPSMLCDVQRAQSC